MRDVRGPLLLLLEVCWGWALAAVFAQAASGGRAAGPSLIGAAAVVLGANGAAGALRQFDIEERTMRAVGIAATIFSLALVLPLEYGLALPEVGPERSALFGTGTAFVILWVRGVLRGRGSGSDEFESALRGVTLGLAPVVVAAGTLPDVRGPEAFGALALVYGMLSLLVLALYRTAEPARPVTALASQWGLATVAIAALAGLLLAIALAIDPGSSGALEPVGNALRPIGEPLVKYVLGPPLRALTWLFRLLLPDLGREALPQPREIEPRERDPNNEGPAWPFSFRALLIVLIVTGIVLATLMLLALLFRRNRQPTDEEELPETEREGTLAGDLSDLFGMIGIRSRRRRDRWSAIAIRRLYAEMLDRAAQDGLVRPTATTPAQFAPLLDARYRSELPTDITLAFAESRYGAREIDRGRVEELRRRWEQFDGR
jgi:hypothetical protein